MTLWSCDLRSGAQDALRTAGRMPALPPVTLVGSLSGVLLCGTPLHNGGVDGQTKFASALALFFGVPFCLAGMAIMKQGVTGLAPSWAIPFGLLFLSAGVTVIGGIFWASRKSRQQLRLQAENPSSPWLWRADWAEGRADSKTKSTMLMAWIFAIFWNTISWGIVFLVPSQNYREKPASLLALLFPAVGIGLLIWAVRETLQLLEFGKTSFQMTSVPLVVGKEFRGAIQARFPKPPQHGIRLKLSCINRLVSGTGRDQTTQEKIIWRDEHTVSPAELYAGPTGTTIPVSFHIPFDARQTDLSNPRDAIFWMLEADADVPGVDYKDCFEVPVFRTKDTPSQPEKEEFVASESQIRPPEMSTIAVTPTADGTQFYFPAARNKGFGANITAFFALSSGILAVILHFHAPFIFPLVFGLFDLLLLYMVLQVWFGTSTVVVNRSGLRVRSGLFGGGKFQEIAAAEISSIEALIRSQQGGATGTPFYDILLTKTDGKKVTLGQTLRDKQEAEWLVEQMKNNLGLQPAKAFAAAAR